MLQCCKEPLRRTANNVVKPHITPYIGDMWVRVITIQPSYWDFSKKPRCLLYGKNKIMLFCFELDVMLSSHQMDNVQNCITKILMVVVPTFYIGFYDWLYPKQIVKVGLGTTIVIQGLVEVWQVIKDHDTHFVNKFFYIFDPTR